MELLAHEKLEHFRESQWSDSDNTGTAMLFEAASARAGRLSSAAAENAKELWRPAVGGKSDFEREKRQIHLNIILGDSPLRTTSQ